MPDRSAQKQDHLRVEQLMGGQAGARRFGGLEPTERIGRPIRRERSTMGPALLVIVVLSALGWAAYKTEALWRPLIEAPMHNALSALEPLLSGRIGTAAPSPTDGNFETASVAPIPFATRHVAAPPANSWDGPASAPIDGGQPATTAEDDRDENATTTVRPPDASDETASSDEAEPLEQPVARTPLQKKALAAGLHPELSRALLVRLKEEDFRNARTAVGKAMAARNDKTVIEWPRNRQEARAVFRVHFVKSAGPDCRRYVVTITLQGWSTTAWPLERCGTPG